MIQCDVVGAILVDVVYDEAHEALLALVWDSWHIVVQWDVVHAEQRNKEGMRMEKRWMMQFNAFVEQSAPPRFPPSPRLAEYTQQITKLW